MNLSFPVFTLGYFAHIVRRERNGPIGKKDGAKLHFEVTFSSISSSQILRSLLIKTKPNSKNIYFQFTILKNLKKLSLYLHDDDR